MRTTAGTGIGDHRLDFTWRDGSLMSDTPG